MLRDLCYTGARVAWRTRMGITAVGEVVHATYWPAVYVKRLDGNVCRLDQSELRMATAEDVVDAVRAQEVL